MRKFFLALLLLVGCGLGVGGCRSEFHIVLFNNTNDQVIVRRRMNDPRPVVVLACTGGDVTGVSTDDLSIERNGRLLRYRYPVGYTFPSETIPSGYERGVRRLGKALCLQLAPDNRLYLLRSNEAYTAFQHSTQPGGVPADAAIGVAGATPTLYVFNLMSVQELEMAVSRLPREDFAQFQAWFEEFAADAWDTQIEADARAGKLDHLIAQADADFDAGRCTPLP